jgi:hypothetical protein
MSAIARPGIGEALRLLKLRLVLPVAFGRQDVRTLLRRLDENSGKAQAVAEKGSLEELERLVQRVFRPLRLWRTTCLFRALAGYVALRSAGARVRLLLGVRAAGGDLQAHAWLERDGEPSIGAPRPEDGYELAFAWPEAGEPVKRPEEEDMASLRRSDEAVLTELRDGTGVLLDLRTRHYFTLNRTGVLVWKLLGEGVPDTAAVVAGVAARYSHVDADAIRRDVEALVAELCAEGLAADVR